MHSIEKPLEIAICNNYLQIVPKQMRKHKKNKKKWEKQKKKATETFATL